MRKFLNHPIARLMEFPSGKRVLLLSYSKTDQKIRSTYSGTVVCLEADDHAKISTFKDADFDIVVSAPTLPFSEPFLGHILRVLRPGGYVSLQAPNNVNFARSLTFAGFVDVSSKVHGSHTEVICRKPPWTTGASAPLSLKKAGNSQPAPTSASKSVWQLAASDLDAEMELEDEDALLEKDDLSDVKAVAMKNSDCGTGPGTSRKACKNCSCGRAELEAEEQKATGKESAPVSACGSCGLGDAFRCSTCPYLGQPAFQQGGDVVKLDL